MPAVRRLSTSSAAQTDAGDDIEDPVDEQTGDAATSAVRGGVYALVKPLADGAVELRAFRTHSNANFCFQAPVVVSKSVASPPNGACPAKWATLSCACVAEANTSAHWDLRVAKRGATAMAPTALATAPTAVTSIGIFILPNNVASLRLTGEPTAQPLSLELRLMYETNKERAAAPQLVTTSPRSALKSVDVVNVDLSSVDVTAKFLPVNLTSISLQQCKISELVAGFLAERHWSLETLNLSGNQLRVFDAGVPSGSKTSTIKSIDLSNNSLSVIPPSLFSLAKLRKLNLRGNPIANLSVSSSQFAQLASLTSFLIDAPATGSVGTCVGGTLQSTAGISFCVVDSGQTTATTPSIVSAPSSSVLELYLGVGVPALLIVLGLVAFFVRRRRAKRVGGKGDSFDVSLLERTASPNSCVLAIDEALLRDSIIAIHRIPFDDVKVGDCINQGGFGVVYTGVFKKQRVAIKRIRVGQHRDVLRNESFLREICLMASLEHPRIVRFVGVAWDDSLRNLSAVTEFMERGDLRDVLQSSKKRGRPLTWSAHKARIALHVAEALAYLHSLEPVVIHRDLKSKNVLLNRAFDAKLSDFGISREWSEDVTSMTAGIGTTFWIAPEVLLGEQYDERADIFSFGVVLSELDTDDYPYWDVPGGSRSKEKEILRMVAAGMLRPKLTPECPPGVALLAEHCLHRDPQRRPTSAQVVDFLGRLLVAGANSAAAASSLSFSSSSSEEEKEEDGSLR